MQTKDTDHVCTRHHDPPRTSLASDSFSILRFLAAERARGLPPKSLLCVLDKLSIWCSSLRMFFGLLVTFFSLTNLTAYSTSLSPHSLPVLLSLIWQQSPKMYIGIGTLPSGETVASPFIDKVAQCWPCESNNTCSLTSMAVLQHAVYVNISWKKKVE